MGPGPAPSSSTYYNDPPPAGAAERWAALRTRLLRLDGHVVLEACQIGASLLFILLYIWSTYSTAAVGSWRYCLDLGLSCFFAADYCSRFAVSARRVRRRERRQGGQAMGLDAGNLEKLFWMVGRSVSSYKKGASLHTPAS